VPSDCEGRVTKEAEVTARQIRPLESMYPVVLFDALLVEICEAAFQKTSVQTCTPASFAPTLMRDLEGEHDAANLHCRNRSGSRDVVGNFASKHRSNVTPALTSRLAPSFPQSEDLLRLFTHSSRGARMARGASSRDALSAEARVQ
jgi:hypothetical protein